MPSFKIAHIKEQGNDLIIIPLESSFGSMSAKDQAAMVADLQAHAIEEKLSGKVVLGQIIGQHRRRARSLVALGVARLVVAEAGGEL